MDRQLAILPMRMGYTLTRTRCPSNSRRPMRRLPTGLALSCWHLIHVLSPRDSTPTGILPLVYLLEGTTHPACSPLPTPRATFPDPQVKTHDSGVGSAMASIHDSLSSFSPYSTFSTHHSALSTQHSAQAENSPAYLGCSAKLLRLRSSIAHVLSR